MPSPFPGMNPYLEEPELGPAVHHDLISALRDALLPLLLPNYFVTIELREYELSLVDLELVAIGDVSITQERRSAPAPNGPQQITAAADGRQRDGRTGPTVLAADVPRAVPVREHFLVIRRPRAHELITVIEVLSPTNKRPGKGRQEYEEKRFEIAGTLTNLIEIDLVRAGEPLPVLQHGALLPRDMAGDYRVLVVPGGRPRRSELYPIGLREPLPTIPIPLRPGDEEPQVDLQTVLHQAYDRGRYDVAIDYHGEPVPSLRPEDAAWADGLLRECGLR